jgi:uncharacterized membrane protein YbhN (UPF0104 family)
MLKKIWPKIRNYVFLALGIWMIYMVFRDVDFVWMWNEIKQAELGWVGLSLSCGLIAMLSRAWRWRMLLEPLGYKPNFLHCFYGVAIGYFANIALPRMGEVVRCTILNQSDDVPVNKAFGTVILERLIDLFMLISLILIVLAARWELFGDFFINDVFKLNSDKSNAGKSGSVLLVALLTALIVLGALFLVFRKRLLAVPVFERIRQFLLGLGDGLSSILRMKNQGWFIFHTLFIWVNYFLMTWVCVFSYGPTKLLKAFDGLFLMVVGGLGMTAPVQGGFGAFHYLVEKALMIYAIVPSVNPITGSELRPGLVFATIVHTGQFVLTICTGIFALVMFYTFRRKRYEA